MDKMINAKSIQFLLLVFLPLFTVAQVQKGYVKTVGRFNAPGVRIAGVSVRIQGNHNAVMSGENGDFSVPMRGDSYVLTSVFKSGYELQEKEVIGRLYAYSSVVPLEIVMISSVELLREKQAIEERIRINIEKEYQTQYRALEKQLKDKTLSEQNYREQLAELQHKLDNNTRLISDMADRYARTDYDKLDSLNQQINHWIQMGKLELADSLLHSKGNLEERERKLQEFEAFNKQVEKELLLNQENARKERDDLARDYYSSHSLALLRLQNDSAGYFLEKRAMLDSTNVEYLLDVGLFIEDYLADYDKSLKYFQKALNHALKQGGEESSDVATSYSNIGNVYFSQGDYSLALEYYGKSLEIFKSTLGENRFDIATNYDNIGVVYSSQGNYVLASEYHVKALELRRSIFGESHPAIATSYNNIGTVYYSQGNYTLALEYHEKSLEIRKSVLGESHPDVAVSYDNIGVVYSSQGNYALALEYYEKALGIRRSIFGESHPDVATSYNNIGCIYNSQGNYALALEYYEKSLKTRKSLFGESHPDVARSYNNIGFVYSSHGDYALALEYYEKSLEIFKSTLGESHPDVATSYDNIGFVYSSQGNYALALDYYEESLEIRKSVLGESHPDVATSYNNIGYIYFFQGNYPIALEYYEKTLGIRKSILGETHPDVAASYNNIGTVYDSQGNYTLALEYYEKSLEICKSVLGESHPNVATSYDNIGVVYDSQGNYALALEYYEKSLEIRKSVLGESHPDVATSYNNIGFVYSSQGNYALALEYYEKSLNIFLKFFKREHSNIQMVISNIGTIYSSFLSQNSSLNIQESRAKMDDFMSHLLFEVEIVEGDYPVSKRGLTGTYYLLKYEDWDMESIKDLYEYNKSMKNKPKTLLLLKDGVIKEYSFQGSIGVYLYGRWVEKEEREKILKLYHNWKEGR